MYPRLGCEHRWKTLEKTQVLSRSVARIQRCNPFISVWATRSIIPDKTSDSIVQPGNNATPRSRVLFSIIIRQVCIKLANCAKNLSFHQFFFLSELSLISQLFTHLSETKKISSLHNLSNSLEEDLLWIYFSRNEIEGRLNGRGKKVGGIAICPNKLGEVFFDWSDFIGARIGARETTSPPPSSWQVWQLSRIHPCHCCLDKSLTKWSFPLFRSANASSPRFNWTFNTLLCRNPFLSLLLSNRPVIPFDIDIQTGESKRYFSFFLSNHWPGSRKVFFISK